MAETKPIPVRLGQDKIDRLDAAAKRIGNNRAGVIRFLVDSWLADFEKRGVASLPPNWEQIIAAADNRTRESKAFNAELNEAANSASSAEGKKHIEASVVSYFSKQSAEKVPPLSKARRKAKAVRPPATPPSASEFLS